MFTIVISEDRDLRDSVAAAHANRHNDVLESNRGLIHLSQKMRKERRALASSVRFLTGRRAATRGKPGRLKVFDRKQNNRASGGAAGQSPFADNLYRRDIRELNSEVLSAQLVAGGTQGDGRPPRIRPVQVGSSCRQLHSRGSYKDLPYTADDIDFLVAYIVPRDVWLVPVKLVPPVVGMCCYSLGCRRGGSYEAGNLMASGGDRKPPPPITIRVPPSVAPGTAKPTQSPRSKNPRETNSGGRASAARPFN
jgi:hypothetical protein